MVTILYIILGISIGVGCTLIFLQGRFRRERRLVIAIGDEEREKSTKRLRDLNDKWELRCVQNKQLKESIAAFQLQLTELQGESDFYKGEVRRLEEEQKSLPTDDFIVLSPPGGGHLLPGSVARALMRKEET